MVVATARSIKDFQAHYDEVADKKQFHKNLPLSNYQKIVDGVEGDDEPTIQQSTISLQSQLQSNAQSDSHTEPPKVSDPEPKETQTPKQTISEAPKEAPKAPEPSIPEPTPTILETPHEEEEPFAGSVSHLINNQNRQEQQNYEKRASISHTFEEQNEIEDMPIEHNTAPVDPEVKEIKRSQETVFDYMDVIKE